MMRTEKFSLLSKLLLLWVLTFMLTMQTALASTQPYTGGQLFGVSEDGQTTHRIEAVVGGKRSNRVLVWQTLISDSEASSPYKSVNAFTGGLYATQADLASRSSRFIPLYTESGSFVGYANVRYLREIEDPISSISDGARASGNAGAAPEATPEDIPAHAVDPDPDVTPAPEPAPVPDPDTAEPESPSEPEAPETESPAPPDHLDK